MSREKAVLFPLLSFVHMGEKEMREGTQGREERGLPGSFFHPLVGTDTEYTAKGGDWQTWGERRDLGEIVRDDISGIN